MFVLSCLCLHIYLCIVCIVIAIFDIYISRLPMALKHISHCYDCAVIMCAMLFLNLNGIFCHVLCLSPVLPLVTYRETSMGVKLNFAYQM